MDSRVWSRQEPARAGELCWQQQREVLCLLSGQGGGESHRMFVKVLRLKRPLLSESGSEGEER